MNGRKWLLAVWLGLTEMILWLPIPVFIASWTLPNSAIYYLLALLPLCYAAGERLTAKFRRMRRLARIGASAAIGLTVGAVLFFPPNIGTAAAAVIAAAFAGRGMTPVLPDHHRQRELLTPALILYFIISIAAFALERLEPYRTLIAVGGVAALLLAVRRLNRLTLIEANLDASGGRLPRSVIIRNRLMAGMFTVIGLFIVFFRQVEAMWRMFIDGLSRLLESLGGRAGNPNARGMPDDFAMMPEMPVEEQGDPGWLWVLLERIAIVVAILVLAALAFWAFRQLLRIPALARMIARWLAAWRERARTADAGGYVDEVEKLSGQSLISGVMERLKSMARRESWNNMTPEERIRWLFRRTVRRAEKQGYVYRHAWTPGENLRAITSDRTAGSDVDAELEEAYVTVRYGDRPANAEAAEQLRRRLGL